MQMIIHGMLRLVELIIVMFLCKLACILFLKHTLLGRIVLHLLNSVSKSFKLCFKYGKKGSKVLVKEAKAMTKNKPVSKNSKTSKKVTEPIAVNGSNVTDLEYYIKEHKKIK